MQVTHFHARGISARGAGFVCAATLFLLSTTAFAQIAGTGNIQGTATDASGAVVVNANITLTNEATHVQRTTQTSGAGVFLFPAVPVGTYDLSAKAPGFKSYVQKGIVLEVGSSIAINPKFSVGAADVEIQVQAEGLALQTEDPTYKQTIDQTEMTEMPLNGRHMTDLILGAGGANTAPGGDFTGSKYSYQTVSVSIAGGGGNTTLWRLDGGDNQDYMANGNLPYPFPDAVSQFSVESTALGAQDGGHVGGMVNVVTRSGTNSFHGEAFEFIRNNYIDATNFFSSSPDTLHQNQFGGTFGGPIKRNKMFAFAAYQRTKADQSQADQQKFVPTADNLKGDFSTTDGPNCESSKKFVQLVDPLTGATIPGDIYPTTPAYNAQALALDGYLPKPIPSVDTNNCGLVSYSIPSEVFDNQFVTRVDYTISSKQNLYGRYMVDGYQAPAFYSPTNILITTQSGNIERVQSFVLGDAYTFTSNLVNAAHITVLRRVDNRGYNPSAINVSALKPAVDLYQGVTSGIELTEGKFTIGGGTNSVSHFNDNTLSIDDDVTWVHGKHQVMFGGEFVRNQLNISNAYESNGNFTFSGIYSGSGPYLTLNGGKAIGDQNLDFLWGTLSGFEQSKFQQNALRGPIPSLYIQDTFHASRRLTLTGGLRWNPNLMPVDYFNRGLEFNMADFLSNTPSTVFPTAPAGILYYGDKGVTREFTKNSPWQFSPNLGFSFDPIGNGKTVIRGGSELAYDNPNFFTAQRNQQNPPYATAIANAQVSGSLPLSFSAPWSIGAITTSPFPQPSVPTPAQAQFFPQSQYIFVVPQFHAAYTIQWTVSVQHEFGRGWQAQLDYIGNATRHDPIGFGVSPAVFIPGNWGPGGTGCTGIVTTGPAAVKPGAAGTPCSTVGNQTSRFLLTILNPTQGNQYKGGGGGSVLVSDTANASYNGMVATLQHRLSSTFSLLANWTWSKCLNIDDASGDYAGTSVEDINNPGLDYGPCGSDYRSIENMSMVAKSGFHFSNRMERLLVNDWELAPLMSISSGVPVNVTSGQDNSLTDVGNDRPSLKAGVKPYAEVNFRNVSSEATREYLNPLAFTQVTTPGTYGNIGRNAFRGPKSFSLDAQVSRIFPIHESLSLTLRLEAFNALNHPNFGTPDAKLTDSKFGQVSSASAARVFQGAVKFSF
jgi:hypothetical protein